MKIQYPQNHGIIRGKQENGKAPSEINESCVKTNGIPEKSCKITSPETTPSTRDISQVSCELSRNFPGSLPYIEHTHHHYTARFGLLDRGQMSDRSWSHLTPLLAGNRSETEKPFASAISKHTNQYTRLQRILKCTAAKPNSLPCQSQPRERHLFCRQPRDIPTSLKGHFMLNTSECSWYSFFKSTADWLSCMRMSSGTEQERGCACV